MRSANRLSVTANRRRARWFGCVLLTLLPAGAWPGPITATWTDGTSSAWEDAANWSSTAAPEAVHLTANGNLLSMLVRGLLIPEGYFRGGSAFPDRPEFGANNSN